ncbi:MAG: adenylate kinase [Oscillospiraceae bacterium]|nr:adenylate kinase [Oscillospiraceae bacterium]
MKIILLGAPGAGKGTQAELICKKLNIPQISTGNIIRAALKAGTPVGLKAKSFMDAGKLVPDEVVIEIIQERLAEADCKNGYILDGFPRTIPQAEALEKMGIAIDKVIDIVVDDAEITERLSGRRVCDKCGATFHIKNNPSTAGEKCDKCDGNLIIRKDDMPETVQDRLKTYHEQTEPLEGYYNNKGILHTIVGKGDISDITAHVFKALEV